MKNLQTLNFAPILALASLFINISGSIDLHPVLTGPHMAYLSSRVAFRCIVSDSSPPITYELMGDGGVPIATGTDLQGDQPASFFLKVAATSEGSYRCKATTEGSTGVSNIIKLSVVTPASNTRVTSEPFPPVAYEGSRIVLKCNVTKGSHLSYTWFFNRKEVISLTSPPFHLTGNELVMAEVTPEHAGHYSCMAWSMVHDTRRFSGSTEVKVKVKVPVGGDVKVEVEYFYRADSRLAAASLSCLFSRGTFPYISWLLNDSVLLPETHADTQFQPVQPHFALANRRHSLVLTMLTSEETGYYRCRVRDSYDDSGPWVESVAVLVRVTDRNLNSMPRATSPTETPPKLFITTTEAISIAFCCFLLLMLAVGVACVYRMFALNHAHAQIATTISDALPLSAPASHLRDKQAQTTSTNSDVLSQTREITV